MATTGGKKVPRADNASCWEDSLPVAARLVAEHDNPHDRTAVRVEVQGVTVGHLPREDAALIHMPLTTLQAAGMHAECEGRIIIASNHEYSIYLHLAELGTVASALQFATRKAPQAAHSLPRLPKKLRTGRLRLRV